MRLTLFVLAGFGEKVEGANERTWEIPKRSTVIMQSHSL